MPVLPRARDPGATAREPVRVQGLQSRSCILLYPRGPSKNTARPDTSARCRAISVKMPRHVARLASLGLAGAVFLDLRGLAVTLTQVVELGAAHVALGDDLDVVDTWGA